MEQVGDEAAGVLTCSQGSRPHKVKYDYQRWQGGGTHVWCHGNASDSEQTCGSKLRRGARIGPEPRREAAEEQGPEAGDQSSDMRDVCCVPGISAVPIIGSQVPAIVRTTSQPGERGIKTVEQ